jgi:hypothetical protein
MNKLLVILSILLYAAPIIPELSAQAEKKPAPAKLPHQEKRYTVAIQPLYLYNNGMRLDFEKRIKDMPAWIQISPLIYRVPKTDSDYNQWLLFSDEEVGSLWGGGLEVNYKYFFNKQESFYVAGGVSYIYHGIKYYDTRLHPFTEDGLIYQSYERSLCKQQINKWGANAYIGYQLPTRSFLFDMYFGFGYRHSVESDKQPNRFNNNMFSPGYSGTIVTTGFRIGVKFK